MEGGRKRGGGVLKHTLQHRLGSWSGLSCKACTGISCNSLSYTDRGEGWKMLSLPALFPCLHPNLGERMSAENTEKGSVGEGEGEGCHPLQLFKLVLRLAIYKSSS